MFKLRLEIYDCDGQRVEYDVYTNDKSHEQSRIKIKIHLKTKDTHKPPVNIETLTYIYARGNTTYKRDIPRRSSTPAATS